MTSLSLPHVGATLEGVKQKADSLKKEIIQVMVDNIYDQNRPDSVAGVFSCLELATSETKEHRENKLSQIHKMFGHKTFHTMEEKW